MELSLQIQKSSYLQPLFQKIKLNPDSMYNDAYSLHSKESEDITQEVTRADVLLSSLKEGNSYITISATPKCITDDVVGGISTHLLDIKSLKFITIPDSLYSFHIECCSNTLLYYTRDRLIELKYKNIFDDVLVDLDAFPLSRLDQVYFIFEYACPAGTTAIIPEIKIIYKERQDLRVWSYYKIEIEDDWTLHMFRRVLKENICLDKQNNPIIILDGFRGIIEFKAIHNIQMQSSKSNAFDCHIRGIIGDVRVDKISN